MSKYGRTEKVGYYYVFNQGNNERLVFKEESDYLYFLEILSSFLKKFTITLHNYTLVAKHYHLLIELQHENLSDFMRELNTKYSLYFNKKYVKRGKLWKSRYKSWHIVKEKEIRSVAHYIENIPKLINKYIDMKNYPYISYCHFNNINPPSYLQKSWVYDTFSTRKELESFFSTTVDMKEVKKIKKRANALTHQKEKKTFNVKTVEKLFENIINKKERNKKIVQLYKEGYSQHFIAKVLHLSQPCISNIIKREK